jgi:threonine/homoserine/homoserine lactone efflux protein
MAIMIWGGAILTLIGVIGLIACVVIALRARRAGLTGPAMQARLQRVVGYNLGALAVSALGLMLVIVGIILS